MWLPQQDSYNQINGQFCDQVQKNHRCQLPQSVFKLPALTHTFGLYFFYIQVIRPFLVCMKTKFFMPTNEINLRGFNCIRRKKMCFNKRTRKRMKKRTNLKATKILRLSKKSAWQYNGLNVVVES